MKRHILWELTRFQRRSIGTISSFYKLKFSNPHIIATWWSKPLISKLTLFDPTEIIVCNIKGLYRLAKIWRFKNKSLLQELSSFIIFRNTQILKEKLAKYHLQRKMAAWRATVKCSNIISHFKQNKLITCSFYDLHLISWWAYLGMDLQIWKWPHLISRSIV